MSKFNTLYKSIIRNNHRTLLMEKKQAGAPDLIKKDYSREYDNVLSYLNVKSASEEELLSFLYDTLRDNKKFSSKIASGDIKWPNTQVKKDAKEIIKYGVASGDITKTGVGKRASYKVIDELEIDSDPEDIDLDSNFSDEESYLSDEGGYFDDYDF